MMLSADSIDQIAAMLARSSRNDRKESRALGRAEERRMIRETDERVVAMREKAHANLKAGIVSGTTQIASGGLRVGSAIKVSGGEDNLPEDSTDKQLSGMQSNHVGSDAAGAAGDAAGDGASVEVDKSKALMGSADTVEGIGKIWSRVYESEAENLEADAVVHESRAHMAERRADEYRDDARDATEMLSKVADFMREVRDAHDSSAKAAILRA
jgi:hypothetical protein